MNISKKISSRLHVNSNVRLCADEEISLCQDTPPPSTDAVNEYKNIPKTIKSAKESIKKTLSGIKPYNKDMILTQLVKGGLSTNQNLVNNFLTQIEHVVTLCKNS